MLRAPFIISLEVGMRAEMGVEVRGVGGLGRGAAARDIRKIVLLGFDEKLRRGRGGGCLLTRVSINFREWCDARGAEYFLFLGP